MPLPSHILQPLSNIATHSFTLRFPPNKPPRALDSHDADIDTYLLRWKTLHKYCAGIPSVQILIFDCPPERSWAGAEPLIVTFITTTREHRRKNCRIFVLLLDTNPSGAILILPSLLVLPSQPTYPPHPPLIPPTPHPPPPPPSPPGSSPLHSAFDDKIKSLRKVAAPHF